MTQINRVSAQDLGRLAALSDGIFAFAATVLVVDIRLPEASTIHSQGELLASLTALLPQVVAWLLSLMTLGIFWVGQQTHLTHVERCDRDLTWLNFVFLLFVTLVPFSTRLLAGYFTLKAAFIVYWFNILCCGASLLGCVAFAERAGMVRTDAPPHFNQAFRRRILIAQGLYAVGAGLGLLNIPLGVAFIVLVQLNYAAAPRISFLWKL